MTQTTPDLGSLSIWDRPLRQQGQQASVPSKRPDPVTGLMSGDAFLNEADALLTQATRTAREVGLVSLLVEGLPQSDGCDPDEQRHAGFAAIGASLLDVRAHRDVVGRVGVGEFNWMCVLSRGSELAQAVKRLRVAVDDHLDGSDMKYRLGFTLANGRRIGFDALIGEARTHRDDPSASAFSTAR